MSFVHLHVHTNFSFGDGAGRIDELVDAARRLGMPALAVTDHDGLYGAVRFYQACKAAGVKPVVGVEISVESILATPAPAARPRPPRPASRRRPLAPAPGEGRAAAQPPPALSPRGTERRTTERKRASRRRRGRG